MREREERIDATDGGGSPLAAARAYVGIFAAAAQGSELAAVADTIVDVLTSSLDLECARLYVVEGDGGARVLRLLADSSRHSVLALDMPSLPLDAGSPAARVVSEGRSQFVEDTHGLRNGGLDQIDGVGRWRLSVGRQAHATLPLIVHGGVFGALGMDWPVPHEFGAQERARLEGLALAVALAVSTFHEVADGVAPSLPEQSRPTSTVAVSSPTVAVPDPLPAAHGPVTASFLVKDGGALAPAIAVPWGGGSIARLSVAWNMGLAGELWAVFWDIFPYGDDGSIGLLLGTIGSSVGGASAQAALARTALRGAVERGEGLDGAVATLRARISGDSPGVCWTSATVALLQRDCTVLQSHQGGESLMATLRSDGRMVVEDAGLLPLGAAPGTAIASRTDLLLPGDRVVWGCGGLAAPGSAARESLKETLARRGGGESTSAARLLDLAGADRRPAVAMVLDVLDRSAVAD